MKKILFILFIISSACEAQTNLVPNGSFELYDTCPNGSGQLSYADNWQFVGASTDYYNACSGAGNLSVPYNIYGYQPAADGVAYIGMVAYAYGEGPPYSIREPAGSFLTTPLTIGEKYFVSFKVALTLNDFESDGACNKLGILFSTGEYDFFSGNLAPVTNGAQVFSNTVVIDSVNWTTISASFVADSAYAFISVGNFFDSLNSTYVNFDSIWTSPVSAYYYFDDIRVSTDSAFGLGMNDMSPENSIFRLYPNPCQGIFTIETTQSQELSIYDAIGQMVFMKSNPMSIEIIDLQFLDNGIYFVQVITNKGISSSKVIISK